MVLAAPVRAQSARRIALRHSGTGARFEGPWHDGRAPDPSAMEDLSAVLADPGCPPRSFDADTIGIVWEIAQRVRLDGELEVHSGFRTPQVNRRVHGAGDSLHMRASAVDIGVPAGRLAAVAEAAIRLRRGGVGIYRGRSFVHLDSGAVRSWGDGSPAAAAPSAAARRDETLARIAAEWRRGTVRLGGF